MKREKSQVWGELRTALERFNEMTTDGKTPIPESEKQRITVEKLYRELNSIESASNANGAR